MPDTGPRRIIYSNVLAVEGLDEKNFFESLLKYLGLRDVQIEDIGGKDKFPISLPALLKTSGFFHADGSPAVTNLAIVRDKNKDDAFKSVSNIVTKSGLEPPPKHSTYSSGQPSVGIFIMPGIDVDGTMLEDLCLKTVEKHPAMKCAEEFVVCTSALEPRPKNLSKAKAQAFLAAQPELVTSVGLGARRRYWDFDSPALEELKRFLMHLK